MKIGIEIPKKMEKPLEIVIERIEGMNKETEVNAEKTLSVVCKQFITQEYSKYLMEEDAENKHKEGEIINE